jgi:hypothetical protein
VRPRPFDVFAGALLALFLVFAALVFYPRFIHYRGLENVDEFFVYASIILAIVCWTWVRFRGHPWRPWMLALITFGILVHFAGGLGLDGGGRVYDLVFFGIRFDKYVHFINALIAAVTVAEIFRFEGAKLGRLEDLAIVLIVLGLGAIVEIAEYFAVRTVPDAGVGHYDNNMLDLIANLCGSVAARLTLPAIGRRRTGPGPIPDDQDLC